MQTCVSIASILKNSESSDKIFIHIADTGISETGKENVRSLKNSLRDFELDIISFDESKLYCFDTGEWSKNIRIKLFATEMFPELDKILWLNGNTIAVKNIRLLYDTNLKGKYCAALNWHKFASVLYDYIPKETLYNDAVVLYNLSLLKQDGKDQRIINYTKRLQAQHSAFAGEYALTLATVGKIVDLPFRMNCFTNFIPKMISMKRIYGKTDKILNDMISESENSVVLRFGGGIRPWSSLKMDYYNPKVYDLWHAYCDMTPYAGLKAKLLKKE